MWFSSWMWNSGAGIEPLEGSLRMCGSLPKQSRHIESFGQSCEGFSGTIRCSQVVEGVWFGDLRIESLLFVVDVAFLASLVRDLQLLLDHFVA